LITTDVFLNQKRINVCEYTIKMAPHDSFGYEPPVWVQDRKREGVEGKLNGNYLRLYHGCV
jgi:hypothetical protein